MATGIRKSGTTWFAIQCTLLAAGAASEPCLTLAQEAKPAAPPAAVPPTATAAAPPALPAAKIADEPKSIDSATLVDPKLRKLATVQFQETSLAEVVQWLQKQTGLNVTLDARSLESVGIDSNSPITDRLENTPVHQLLDRLQRHKIGWTLQGGVLQLHAQDDHVVLYNTQYNVGDLLDVKFEGADLQRSLQSGIHSVTGWADDGGAGDMVLLGDVLFIRQDSRTHRRISPEEDPEAIIVKYYLMPTEVAEDLEKALPTLLHPESWKSEKQPAAVGVIRRLRSWSKPVSDGGEPDKAPPVSYSTLIIEQKRKIHLEIPDILHKIQHGDAQPAFGADMGGMGGMGGGFF